MKWLWCAIVGHVWLFKPDTTSKSEDAYFFCERCGKTEDYYF